MKEFNPANCSYKNYFQVWESQKYELERKIKKILELFSQVISFTHSNGKAHSLLKLHKVIRIWKARRDNSVV